MSINEGMTLKLAQKNHALMGGYLLRIGEAGGSLTQDRDGYVVCDEDEAVSLYGRSPEQLRYLDRHGYSEATAGMYPEGL